MRKLTAILIVLLLTCPLIAQSPEVRLVPLSSSTCATTGCAFLSVAGLSHIAAQITGTFTGTISFEVSVDGATYVALSLTPPNSTTPASSATTTGAWLGSIGGAAIVRLRMSAYTDGTALVTLKAAP